MLTIAVSNRKGGIGKSTVSAHLAAGLATLGFNVGLVDTDSQGHASLMLSMPEENGLFAAMVDKKDLREIVRHVPAAHYSTTDKPSQGNLWLLPSSSLTYRIPHMVNPDEGFLFLQKMEEMGELFQLDAVIIDTSPTLTLLDGAIYLATDAFIYVTECERLSLDGVVKALEQMQRFTQQRRNYLNRDSRIIGIVPNKMRARTRLHRRNIRALGEQFGSLVWSPVILGTVWAEATNVGELVYTYAPSGQEAEDAWKLVEHTLEVIRSWHTTDMAR